MTSRSRIEPFDTHSERYDSWFVKHDAAYLSEVLAVRAFLPWQGLGLEIGVGSGRFASPLGVQVGLDPSRAMLTRAAARGITAIQGVGESLPFRSGSFDHVLLVTTICFAEDPLKLLTEARRILKPQGRLVIGFIDRQTVLGRQYETNQSKNVFYRGAVFHSVAEMALLIKAAGFIIAGCGQTLRHSHRETREVQPLLPGSGAGAFVVIAAEPEGATPGATRRSAAPV